MYCICCFVFLFIPRMYASMNIAKGKSATQSSNLNGNVWGADKAVDGFTNRSGIDREVGCGCCSHTYVNQRTAWWQVDLKVPSRIQTVKIFYRKLNPLRLAGFSLYLNNTTERRGKLCYKDSGPALPDPIQTINCPFTARYVYMYNERLSGQQYPPGYSEYAVLELCEVEVYGCPLMKYGVTCAEDCSIGCNALSYVCEPDTGNCTFGCKTGFGGLRCDECVDGYYGNTCTPCSRGCAFGSCKQDNGYCNLGCQGSLYGDFCNLTCPVTCKNNRCDQSTGDCVEGRCPLMKYGVTCAENCSIGCNAVSYVCEPDTGNCTFGCKTGFRGLRCDECVDGYYGNTCTPCSRGCAFGSCKQDNGYCNLSCQGSLYGDFCNLTCPVTCRNNRCAQSTGGCVEGRVQTDYFGLIIGGIVSVSMINIVFLVIVLWKRSRRNGKERSDQSSQTSAVGLPETGSQQHDNHNLEQQQAVEYETLGLEDREQHSMEQQQAAVYMKLKLDDREQHNMEQQQAAVYMKLKLDDREQHNMEQQQAAVYMKLKLDDRDYAYTDDADMYAEPDMTVVQLSASGGR